MLNVEKIKTRYILFFLSAIAVIPILLYSDTPLFADDFTWFTFLKDNQNKSFNELLITETPFGYFRPLTILIFRAIYFIASDNAFVYRVFSCLFQILIFLLLYKIFYELSFSKTISFWTVFMFSVLASHAEVIFLINCLNILVADFLVLCGIYFILKREKPLYSLAAIVAFLLSLLCRESSFNYVFLSLLIFLYTGRKNKLSFTAVLFIPLISYFIIRYLFVYLNPLLFSGNHFEPSFNIVKSTYKIFHYFVIAVFPVKSIFYITGFELYDSLRSSFSGKSDQVLFYVLMFFTSVFVLLIISYTLRILKKKIIFPSLFFLSCLMAYIPAENVAERFSYLASAGISLLMVLVLAEKKSSKLITSVFILFLILHLTTLLIRGDSYRVYAKSFSSAINDLHNQLKDDNQPSVIMIENLPEPYYGQMLVSTKNFNDAYRYFYPEEKIEFILKNNVSDLEIYKKINKTYKLDYRSFKFNRLNIYP